MSQEIQEKFEKAQQELIEAFKVRMKDASNKAISDLYCDVSNYAVGDAFLNFRNYLREEMRESFMKEISEENGHYSWAHSIRMELLKSCPGVLRNKIISDLEDRCKSLEQHIDQLQRNRF